MKKQLLGTTALVAAGLFVLADAGPASAQQKVEPIKVSVGGYVGAFVSYVDQDDVAADAGAVAAGRSREHADLDTHTDQEIHFNGRTTLANGITIGFRIELEGNTEGDQIDESYLFLESKFGRLELGQVNNVHYRMAYKAPDVFTRGWVNEGNFTNVMTNPTGSPNGDSTINTTVSRFRDNDSDKINYFTPRFAGFQLGASYIPDSSQDTAAPTTASSAYTRGWAVAANFVRTFGQFDVAAYAGYMTWQGPQTSPTATAPDPDHYSVGLQLGFAGFRVGGSYGKIKDGRAGAAGTAGASNAGTGGNPVPATNTLTDGDAWDVGVSYTFGPASISLTYMDATNDDSVCSNATQVCGSSGDDQFSMVSLAGKYVLGPGISWDTAIFWAEFEGNTAGTSLDNNEAIGIVTGFVLVF